MALVALVLAPPLAPVAARSDSRISSWTEILLTALTLFDLAILLPFANWPKGAPQRDPRLERGQETMVDGVSGPQVMRILAPGLIALGLLVAGIFSFVIAWNEVLGEGILTDAMSLAIHLARLGEEDPATALSAAGMLLPVPTSLAEHVQLTAWDALR
ncbi:MAG: hypothetical protein AAGI50_14310 [Pseudomonadota bacterium]